MKILLQHGRSGLYLKEPGKWTPEIAVATDFQTSQKAIDYLRAECMTDVRVVAVFVGSGHIDSVCYTFNPAQLRTRMRA